MIASLPSFRTHLKHTRSRCPVCHDLCPAEVWKTNATPSKVYLTRTCPEHGEASMCISSDARFYWMSKGSDDNACCGSGACCADPTGNDGTLGRNALAEKGQTVETLSTCLALIEIVDSCNLACPTCFAASPTGVNEKLDYHSLENIQERIEGVLDRKKNIEILQLSGGEPTLHPQFFELLDWIHERDGIDYVLVNTNGVLIAKDDVFLTELGQRARRGNFQLYLQFDGTGPEAQKALRGGDLRAMKQRVMERCAQENIPVTLAMTVTPQNVAELWSTIQFGLAHDNCRGVSFQPMFWSGRMPDGIAANQLTPEASRLNAADIILGCVDQSDGTIKFEDFTPLPCGDPNCATIGYLLKTPLGVRSISDFIDFSTVQDFLQDKVRYELADLQQCGCENTALGELLHKFEMEEKDTFRLFIKPFMDSWTWDEDRIDRCCTHVIRPDGKLDSFCRYYHSGIQNS
ncbi:radical SAM protein [Verrucomicrobiaceae bacterium 5K15]|uniref:Radical SAM protein n=1 Tax=Oceaniferula flava TaxID=2800421 RepID=A0AAE2SAK5_9BACT|nr:radical SAM protein [Oceaniferula flavus]MBK1853882.1 radical SAM protein [Oceaniferula flavus]MBM1135188.1 radical SAM protein [Oceaniferula flavus]